MNMQSASWVKWSGLTVSLAMLAGCVVNPYIKDGQVSAADLNHAKCEEVSKVETLTGADLQKAYQYAECVRRAMANKAGRYAWMNNAGGATLIHMAGFAGYSGIRGGHQAQVAAFSAGGAAAYGTQQYLYSKPREAIYWSGSQAIGCAIGVTRRRSLISDQAMALKTEKTRTSLDSALRDARNARASLVLSGDCDDVETKVKVLEDDVDRTHARFRARDDAISARKQRLSNASASAAGDLMTAIDAIRDTVNGQLAHEQPDPAELSKLLSTLKLPALNGPAAPAQKDDIGAIAGNGGLFSMLETNRLFNFSVHGLDSPPKTKCIYDTNALDAYQAAVNGYLAIASAHDHALADVEARLAAIETLADADQKGPQMKHCTVGRTNTLLPFGLTFAQAGVQKVSAGNVLSIPISGGVPPYAITVVSSSGGDIPAVARQTDEGGFEIVIGDASTTKGAKATLLVNDDIGASKPVSVEVVD